MTHRHSYGIEKLQVQLTAVAAGVAAYFLIWPIVRPADPASPVTFLADGSIGGAAVLAAVTCALAAACCLTTVSSRPEGTMAAVLIGLGGVSLHSGPMRELLWLPQTDLAGLYWRMALEVLLLAGVAAAAAVVVKVVRRLLSAAAGRWCWRDPLTTVSDRQQRVYLKAVGDDGNGAKQGSTGLLGGGFARLIVEHLGIVASRQTGRRTPGSEIATRYVLCFLTCLIASVSLVWLLARSTERGQILFALAAGCFLAAVIAYQAFPTRWSAAAWAAPIIAGVGYYALAAIGSVHAGRGAWMQVEPCYQALPIDWLTAGVGGALAGYWASSRIHEAKFLEILEEQEEGA